MLGSKPLFYEMPWDKREKLTELLIELEWAVTGGDYRSYCPMCSESKDKGHDNDCLLKAVIDVWSDNEPN